MIHWAAGIRNSMAGFITNSTADAAPEISMFKSPEYGKKITDLLYHPQNPSVVVSRMGYPVLLSNSSVVTDFYNKPKMSELEGQKLLSGAEFHSGAIRQREKYGNTMQNSEFQPLTTSPLR